MTTRAQLEALVERVRAATGPDREIDVDIIEALGHQISYGMSNYTMESYAVVKWAPPHPYAGMREPCPELTASLDAVVAMIERELNAYSLSLHIDPSGCGAKLWVWPDGLSGSKEEGPFEGMSGSPTLALLAVFLSAKLSSLPEEA